MTFLRALIVLTLVFDTYHCEGAAPHTLPQDMVASSVSSSLSDAYPASYPWLTGWWRRATSATADGSWLWGWAWGAESTVSVVDRSPSVSFPSRPASFGPLIDDPVLGYGIPMNAFTVICEDDGDKDKHPNRRRGGWRTAGGIETTTTSSGDRKLSRKAHTKMKNQESDNVGCPKLCPSGKKTPEPSDSWIAIVQRGECAFVDKVREAQRFGAKAVVVGGDNPDESGNPDILVNMYSQGDSSDVDIPSTFIKYSDYVELTHLIATSNTSTSGIRTVSLQITSDYSSWEWYSPILTFIVLLLLPSALTLVTLLIHRIRAARAERRERAPEEVVNNLPWRVWTGTCWEKDDDKSNCKSKNAKLSSQESTTTAASATATNLDEVDLERGVPDAELARSSANVKDPSQNQSEPDNNRTDVDADLVTKTLKGNAIDDILDADANAPCKPSSSHCDVRRNGEVLEAHPWFEAQTECAICLFDFERGDRIRVLPCKHIFHMEEIDEWLIHRKKLCPVCKADVTRPVHTAAMTHPHPHPDRGHHSRESVDAGGPDLSNSNTDQNTPYLDQGDEPSATERTPLLGVRSATNEQ